MTEYIPKHASMYLSAKNVEALLVKANVEPETAKEMILQSDCIEAEPRIHSSWKTITFFNGSQYKICENCAATLHRLYDYPRCWRCGAIMDEEN